MIDAEDGAFHEEGVTTFISVKPPSPPNNPSLSEYRVTTRKGTEFGYEVAGPHLKHWIQFFNNATTQHLLPLYAHSIAFHASNSANSRYHIRVRDVLAGCKLLTPRKLRLPVRLVARTISQGARPLFRTVRAIEHILKTIR